MFFSLEPQKLLSEMLTDGPFLLQHQTIVPIFARYRNDLVHCMSSFIAKESSRSCIDAAYHKAHFEAENIMQRPFSGDLVLYQYSWSEREIQYVEEGKICFFDRPRVLAWLKKDVPQALLKSKEAALNMVNNDFAHYGQCLSNPKSAIGCRSDIIEKQRSELTAQWKSVLMSGSDLTTCQKHHDDYYFAINNAPMPTVDFLHFCMDDSLNKMPFNESSQIFSLSSLQRSAIFNSKS